jgi:hypothetical protein
LDASLAEATGARVEHRAPVMHQKENILLYKYRGLTEFKFFVDIFLKKRLYAAPYFDMNDPMEGQYLYHKDNGLDEDIRNRLKGEKEKLRICSVSRNPMNELMWSHYAEGHRGVAIGVEVNSQDYNVRPVIYDGPMLLGLNNLHTHSAIDILCRKHKVWHYEEEERVFVSNQHFVNVEVKEVIFGQKISNQDKSLVTELISTIDPNITIRNYSSLNA